MKRLWILGIAFTILGSGILFVGLGISKGSNDNGYYGVTINGEKVKSVESSYDVPESLKLHVDGCDMKVVEGTQEDKVTIQYPNIYEVIEEEGTLSIQQLQGEKSISKTPWYRKIVWNNVINVGDFDVNTVVVTLPKNYKGEIQIESDSGDITCKNLTSTLEKFSLDVSSGDVRLEQMQIANTMQIRVYSGDLTLKNIIADKAITIENIYGDVSVTKSKGKTMSIIAESGDMDMKEMNTDSLDVEMLYGDLNMRDVKATQLTIKNNSGDIVTKNLDADDISIEGVEGDISCRNLSGSYDDYKIQANTQFGDCNISSKLEGKKTLRISTKSGDIHVSFYSK